MCLRRTKFTTGMIPSQVECVWGDFAGGEPVHRRILAESQWQGLLSGPVWGLEIMSAVILRRTFRNSRQCYNPPEYKTSLFQEAVTCVIEY